MNNAAKIIDLNVALAEGKRVLSHEANSLSILSDSLAGDFTRAVEIILNTPGRIVVTGMGKSGHVANKIAATMASTGTPAFFVHPAEASHGDLGMICEDDCVIALSNSGETCELAGIISYTGRFSIPLIAITGTKTSTLAQIANVALILPDCEEACPIGLAPTTSTTLMMALGDAIACSILKERGFSPDDFGVFHPGGSLGKRVKMVKDIMHTEMPLVKSGSLMSEALVVMTQHGFGCVGVIDGGNLIGVITDGDLRRHMNLKLLEQTVNDVMTGSPKYVLENSLVAEATAILNSKSITSLFVRSNNELSGKFEPKGIIHIHDCLRSH